MVQTPISPTLLYPESDGKPMADSTIQYRWIVRLGPDQDFTPVMPMNLPWTSTILGICFELTEDSLEVFYPNRERFKGPKEYIDERDKAFAKLRELGIDPSQL